MSSSPAADAILTASSLAAADRCIRRSAIVAASGEAPWDGFSGLIPVAEDDAWGRDAPPMAPPADPATHPPLAPLLRELAAGEAAAVEAAFGPARVLLGEEEREAATRTASTRPPDPAALEAAALAALDAGDVRAAVAHLRAAAVACEKAAAPDEGSGGSGPGRPARIARYLAAAEAMLGGAS